MTTTIRTALLRANAAFIGIAAFVALIFDLRGVFLGLGPQGRILANAPYAGIGFVEAHGLAWILAVLLWRAMPTRTAHLTAVAMELLRGTSNLIFWQMFVATDALVLGYVTTILHCTFAVAQLTAAASASDAVGSLLGAGASPFVGLPQRGRLSDS